MGLFNKKDKGPCAICGGKLPMFPYNIDGQQVCNQCYGDVNLPKEIMENITLEGFKEYMTFREENAALKQRFQTTRQVDFGWFDDKFLFDTDNRLLCMDKKLRKPIFEGRQITSFEIREDQAPLFSGSTEGLVRYTSTVPERVMAMAPQIDQLKIQAEMRREMERMLEHRKQENGNTGTYSLPTVNVPVVFQKFIVEIHFEHPYWPFFTADKGAPEFSSTEPDVNNYLKQYNEDFQLMEELAKALMEVAFPGAPERTVASAGAAVANSSGVSAPGVAVGVLEEVQRLKELMDKGIITEEEFTAKKRKLLDIPL